MTGQHGAEEHVTRVVNLDTLGAAVRELAVGQDSVTVVVRGRAGEVLGVVRTRTVAEQVEAAHVVPPRPAPRAFKRSTDPRHSGGVQTYGIPGPEMDAPGPLKGLRGMRQSSHHLARGLGAP